MSFLKEFFLMILAGIVLWLAYLGGNFVAVFLVSLLPLGMLGGIGDFLGVLLIIAIMGAVGRYVVKQWMP